jgi:hypothetical protein
VTTPGQHFNNRVLNDPRPTLDLVVMENSDPQRFSILPLPSDARETYPAEPGLPFHDASGAQFAPCRLSMAQLLAGCTDPQSASRRVRRMRGPAPVRALRGVGAKG